MFPNSKTCNISISIKVANGLGPISSRNDYDQLGLTCGTNVSINQ